MADHDPTHPAADSPRDRLLDELESIKDLLERELDGADLPPDIPILNDIVQHGAAPEPEPEPDPEPQAGDDLFDLESIFDGVDTDLLDDGDFDMPGQAPAFEFPRFTLDVTISDEEQPSLFSEPPPPAAPPPAPAPLAPVQAAPEPAPEPPPAAGHRASPVPRVRPDYSREVLIQELVDEFIPQIEAALRERLDQLDLDTLRRHRDNS